MDIKEIDKKILNHMQKFNLCSPRVTKIAKDLGLPTSTVHERIRQMEKNGIIEGYTALINPQKVGKDFVVFVFGQTKLTKLTEQKEYFEDVGEKIAKLPFVQEVYFIAGEWDIICKMRCRNREEYYEKVKKIVRHFDIRGQGIITTKTFKDTPKFEV